MQKYLSNKYTSSVGKSTLHNKHLSMLLHTIFLCTTHIRHIPFFSFTCVMFINKHFNITCVHMSQLQLSKCFEYIYYIKHYTKLPKNLLTTLLFMLAFQIQCFSNTVQLLKCLYVFLD